MAEWRKNGRPGEREPCFDEHWPGAGPRRLRRLAAARPGGRRRRRRPLGRHARGLALPADARAAAVPRRRGPLALHRAQSGRGAGPNPAPRTDELRPFTRAEIDALAAELGPVYGPLVIFAAETGLRTNEWAALERRDIDRGAVLVQRRVADGTMTPYPKTGRRRVPLTGRARRAGQPPAADRHAAAVPPPRAAASSAWTPGARATGIRRSAVLLPASHP
jgi:integrase